MKQTLLLLLLLVLPTALFADDFDSPKSLDSWKRFDAVEGWPDMLERYEVADGKMVLVPYTSGWYAEFHAPYVFQEKKGNFVATTRLRVRGKSGTQPNEPWSLAGLMVRAPRKETAKTWTPAGENWLFITTGIAFETGKPVFETKTTVNSESKLRLHPAREGWLELRIARTGAEFVLSSRYDNEEWQERARFSRPDLPETLQVGINAYTGWDSAQDLQNDPKRFNTTVLKDRRADAVVEVDWVRFE